MKQLEDYYGQPGHTKPKKSKKKPTGQQVITDFFFSETKDQSPDEPSAVAESVSNHENRVILPDDNDQITLEACSDEKKQESYPKRSKQELGVLQWNARHLNWDKASELR